MGRQRHDIGHRKHLERLERLKQGDEQSTGYAVLDHCKWLVARGLASEAILGGATLGRRWSRENGFAGELRQDGDDE